MCVDDDAILTFQTEPVALDHTSTKRSLPAAESPSFE
jgi:hypothetical protein